MAEIHAVIFDVDGTLVDSNDVHARAWVEAMAENGQHVSLEKIGRLIGMGGDKALPETIHVEKDQDLKGALAIYDGPADLLEQYDHSPLAKSV